MDRGETPLVFGSVCSGIEAASVAWHPHGWRAAFLSEIEPFPRAVLAHHYPETPLHGDFTTIRAGEYDAIDLLVGGTPCQSFSVAGLRGGLDDDRGNLALEYLRLADRLRPRWLVWENVPGVLSSNGGRDFGSILGGMGELGYGVAYRVLDAQFFGVAQRRRRVFVVGYLGDWRRAAAVLFERHSLSGHPAPRRATRSGTAYSPGFGPGGGGVHSRRTPHGRAEAAFGGGANCNPTDVSTAISAHPGGRFDVDQDTFLVANALSASGVGTCGADDNQAQANHLVASALRARDLSRGVDSDCTDTLVAHSLRGEGFDASEDGTGRGTPLVPVAFALRGRAFGAVPEIEGAGDRVGALRAASGGSSRDYVSASAVRRLTPRECERLQGFPDDYTLVQSRGKPAADGPRYKALGNSMAVPVMAWIGQRIAAVEALHHQDKAA